MLAPFTYTLAFSVGHAEDYQRGEHRHRGGNEGVPAASELVRVSLRFDWDGV